MALVVGPLSFQFSTYAPPHLHQLRPPRNKNNHHLSCQSTRAPTSTQSIKETATAPKSGAAAEYKPGILDGMFLSLFRRKMVQIRDVLSIWIFIHLLAPEVGWDSEKPGYEGLIEVANHLMMGRSSSDTKETAVRILRSLFPVWLLELYRMLIAPLGGGKVAAIMVARVTALSCQWLMGPCEVNSVDLGSESLWMSGVFVERCKYLEESKCVGICINTCKLPTQTFFKNDMGVPLVMEPNFSDYSCQFKFGVLPPTEDDQILKEPCLDICPRSNRRKQVTRDTNFSKCPKA